MTVVSIYEGAAYAQAHKDDNVLVSPIAVVISVDLEYLRSQNPDDIRLELGAEVEGIARELLRKYDS